MLTNQRNYCNFVRIVEGGGISSPMVKTYDVRDKFPTETSDMKQTITRTVVDTTVKKVAVIGDIHGTTKFIDGYIHILKHNNYVDKIIVMGDHFDPYDEIPFETMVERYEEFVNCMKHDDRIISLLGNHDLARYIIKTDQTSRTAKFHTTIRKISELIESNLDESRIMFTMGEYLFSHAGVSEYWMNSVAEPQGYNFETLNKKGWTREELCKILNYYKWDFSGWGNNPYQSPIWIRPEMLVKHPYGNYIQVVGHTLMCIELYRKKFKVDAEDIDGFYKTVMCNGKDLWFTDNDGNPEYLILTI